MRKLLKIRSILAVLCLTFMTIQAVACFFNNYSIYIVTTFVSMAILFIVGANGFKNNHVLHGSSASRDLFDVVINTMALAGKMCGIFIIIYNNVIFINISNTHPFDFEKSYNVALELFFGMTFAPFIIGAFVNNYFPKFAGKLSYAEIEEE